MENDKTTPGYEEWNTLAVETVRQVKGLKLQVEIAEGILENAKERARALKPKEEQPKQDTRPDTATDDVKTNAQQKRKLIRDKLKTHNENTITYENLPGK